MTIRVHCFSIFYFKQSSSLNRGLSRGLLRTGFSTRYFTERKKKSRRESDKITVLNIIIYDISSMRRLQCKRNLFFFVLIKFDTFQTVFVFFIIKYEPVTYGSHYTYPWWGEGLGITLSLISMVWIPLYAAYYLLTEPGTLKQVIINYC